MVVDDRAKLTQVEPGQRSGLSTQILSGVDDGDIVINHPEITWMNAVGSDLVD